MGLVEDLRGQLAKVSKERNAMEKKRDDNDQMVTALKQELEKVRKEKVLEVKEAEKLWTEIITLVKMLFFLHLGAKSAR